MFTCVFRLAECTPTLTSFVIHPVCRWFSHFKAGWSVAAFCATWRLVEKEQSLAKYTPVSSYVWGYSWSSAKCWHGSLFFTMYSDLVHFHASAVVGDVRIMFTSLFAGELKLMCTFNSSAANDLIFLTGPLYTVPEDQVCYAAVDSVVAGN